MKRNLSIILLFLMPICHIQCQEAKKERKQIHLLQIKTDCIYSPLDRAISLFDCNESKKDTWLFFIDIVKRPQDSIYSLHIEYETNIDLSFNYVRPVYGYFYYRNCLFVVNGLDSETFFSRKDNTTCFEYILYPDDQLAIIDDSRPYWWYYYLNGKFVLYGESIPPEYSPQHNNE